MGNGHIQDIVDAEMFGEYDDYHRQAFQIALPIRVTAPATQLIPWYSANFIRPLIIRQPVCTPHLDDPGVQFPARDRITRLQLMLMRFKAIDWLVIRNRNTGAIKFLHHATWGFDFNVKFDLSDVENVNPEDGPIAPVSAFPDPQGKLIPIEDGPGKGTGKPSKTEGVFNEEAHLVRQ